MMKDKEELKKEITSALFKINGDNFHNSYDELLNIILNYKKSGFDKGTVLASLSEVDSEIEMNDYQEDVFLEICSRVEGFSSDTRNISW